MTPRINRLNPIPIGQPTAVKTNESQSQSFSPEEKTSDLLRRVLQALPHDQVPLGQLIRRLRRRSFGGILMVLGVIALVPGVATLAGLAMLIPGTQMLLGYRAPLLPRFIRRREIRRDRLRALGDKVLPWLQRMERYVRPRWLGVTQAAPFTKLIGLLVICLALIIVLPLPLSNGPPAIALLTLSLGLLERDGLLMCGGIVVGLVALAIGVSIALIAAKTFIYLT